MLRIFIALIVTVFMTCSASAQMPSLNEAPVNQNTSHYKSETKRKEPKEIWLAYSPLRVRNTAGGQNFCEISIKLRNESPNILKRLEAKFEWDSWTNPIKFSMFNPKQVNSIFYRLPGAVCGGFDNPPKVRVSSCIMENETEADCISMIKLKGWDEF